MSVELADSRVAEVGGLTVRRALPQRRRRTVGAWCFADHMGPAEVAGPLIGPHPHTGLHTVTWLVEGELLHKDSLGTEQVVKPGQVNLMTAGNGVAHAEEESGPGSRRLHGVQLWVAQPEETRWGAAAFEHHASLPQAEVPGGVATVLAGALLDAVSPARTDTPLLGADLLLDGLSTWPLRPDFEYALLVLDGAVSVDGEVVRPGALAYLGEGRDELALDGEGRALLLGGTPFAEPVVMWWNFVARSHDEIDAAQRSWMRHDDRFGPVRSDLPRIPVGPPPWAS
jgi:redox-sensitive bicupin YhaK (pirin superfamily)